MKKFLSILLSVMMILSTVSFAAPMAWTGADDAYESTVVVDTPAADLVEVTADLAEDVSAYGALLLDLDFEDSTYPDSSGQISDCGHVGSYSSKEVYLPGELAGTYPRVQASKASSYTAYEKVNGSNVYTVTGGGYPFFNIVLNENDADWGTNWATSGFDGWPEGTYVYTVDVARDAANVKAGQVQLRLADVDADLTAVKKGGAGLGVGHAVSSEMTSYTVKLDVVRGNDGEAIVTAENGATVTLGDGFRSIGIYFGESNSTDKYYVDNFKLYYLPAEVEANIYVDGVEYGSNVFATGGISTTEFAEIIGLELGFDKIIESVEGGAYLEDGMIFFTENSDVEITTGRIDLGDWYDEEIGYALFKVDFEDAATGAYALQGSTEVGHRLGEFGAEFSPILDKIADPEIVKSIYFSQNSLENIEVVEENGNKYLKGLTNGGGYPMFQLITGYGRRGLDGDFYGWTAGNEGIITLVHKYYTSLENTYPTYRFASFTASGSQESEVAEYNRTPGGETPANTWMEYTVTHVDDGKNAPSTDYIKMHIATGDPGKGAVLATDNVAVYWKPLEANISLDANGFEEVLYGESVMDLGSYDTSETLAVVDILANAGADLDVVSNLTYVFKGISTTKDGSGKVYGLGESVKFAGDTTYYLIFDEVDMSDYIYENGILLFSMDFDNEESVTALAPNTSTNSYDVPINSFGVVNPNFAGSESWKIQFSNFHCLGVVDGTLKIAVCSNGRWPQILMGIMTDDGTMIVEGGTFYIHTEVKGETVPTHFTAVNLQTNGYIDGVDKGANGIMGFGATAEASVASGKYKAGEWITLEGTNSCENVGIDGPKKFTHVFNFDANSDDNIGSTFYLDNIAVYWKPDEVNVTVDAGEASSVFGEQEVAVKTATGITGQQLAKELGFGTWEKQFVGFATEENGPVVYELSDTIAPALDITLYAVWTDYAVLEDYSVEFEKTGMGASSISQYFSIGTYGNVSDIGNGGSEISTAIRTMYNTGYYTSDGNFYHKATTIKAADTAGGGDCGWDVDAIHGIRHYIKPTTTTAAGEAIGILFKYRYTNLPDKLTSTYTDRTGATKTYTLEDVPNLKIFLQNDDKSYAYGGGYCSPANTTTVEEGVWRYEYVPIDGTNGTSLSKGIMMVLIDPVAMTDGMIFELDYVRFIGEPVPAVDYTITVHNYDGTTTEIPVTKEKVKIADILEQIKTSFGFGVFHGLSYTDGGDVITDASIILTGDTDLYGIWEPADMTEWLGEPEKGILLADIDFAGLADGAIANYTEIEKWGRVNPWYENFWYINMAYVSNARVENEAFVADFALDSGRFPQIMIQSHHSTIAPAEVFAGPGYFYVEADMYFEGAGTTSMGITPHGMINGTSTQQGSIRTLFADTENPGYTRGTWGHVAGTFDARSFSGMSMAIILWNRTEVTTPDTYKFDDFRIYWRPSTVSVTVDVTDNTSIENVTFDNVDTLAKVGDIEALLADTGNKRLVGLSLTEGGDVLAADASLNLVADTTLYAVWDDLGVVLDDSFEFNADENIYETYKFAWGSYGAGANAAKTYANAANTITEDGVSFARLTPVVNEGGEGIKDPNTQLLVQYPAGAVKGIAVRMRITGAPDEDTQYTVFNGETTSTETLTLKDQYVQIYFDTEGNDLSETYSWRKTIDLRNGSVYDGEWFTWYIDIENGDFADLFANNKIEFLRFDTPNYFIDGMNVDVDYIRFYGDKEYAPATSDEVDVRNDTITGIRYKAGISGTEKQLAPTYGWVVAAADSIEAAGLTYDDVTVDQTEFKVKVGYAKLNGEQLVNDFNAEDDENIIFSLVTYNFQRPDVKIVARPFTVVGGEYFYGEAIAYSYNEAGVPVA